MTSKSKKFVEDLFAIADIKINGDRPWDIQVKNEKFYDRFVSQGSLGMGESYMDGWWDAEKLEEFFERALRNNLNRKVKRNFATLGIYLQAKIFNLQKSDAFHIGKHHYDIGNDLYEAMLDKRLTYTCGYWKDAKNLDEAQEAKLDLVCKKIGLKKGQKVLDIGSGWGSFIKFAAERYGATCVGLTVSKEQVDYANSTRGDLPIETRLQDYRDINEKFDHVVSLGMFEHVGDKNYRTYMEKVDSLLKDDGLFLLHTIGSNISTADPDPWIAKYIFPNSTLPSIAQIAKAAEELFIMEDWHNFGTDYDKTLMVWFNNFNNNWPNLKSKYGDRFYKMWKYYLLAFVGSFRARNIQLWQIVFSKKGAEGGYRSIR
jgi:cyclopropane-fatty-acyl-phospholipid synthase